jgi:hypothetical protein
MGDRLTFLTTGFVLGSRRNNVWQRDLCRIVRAQDVNINHPLEGIGKQRPDQRQEVPSSTRYHKIDPSKLLHTSLHGRLEVSHFPDIDGADTEHHGALSRRRDILGHAFCLLDVPSHDAGICAEVDECVDLSTADAAGTTGAEDYLVLCSDTLAPIGYTSAIQCQSSILKIPAFQMLLTYSLGGGPLSCETA